MAQARAVAKNSHSPEELKALCKRILKFYIIRRKEDWDSYVGRAKSVGKRIVGIVTFGAYGSSSSDADRIIDDCDELKKDIEDATTLDAYYKLIEKLFNKAIAAKSEEIPWLSKPSLRTDTYHAIMQQIQEILTLPPTQIEEEEERLTGKPSLNTQFKNKLASTRLALEKAKVEATTLRGDGKTVDDAYDNINNLLRELVLLGDRESYDDAFGQNRNLFPHFTRLTPTTYVTQKDINNIAPTIKAQLTHADLTKPNNPNMNNPFQLQPYFTLLYLHKEFGLAIEPLIEQSIKDKSIAKGKTFHEQYETDPKSFTAINTPADMKDLLENAETPPVSPGGVQEGNSNNAAPAEAKQLNANHALPAEVKQESPSMVLDIPPQAPAQILPGLNAAHPQQKVAEQPKPVVVAAVAAPPQAEDFRTPELPRQNSKDNTQDSNRSAPIVTPPDSPTVIKHSIFGNNSAATKESPLLVKQPPVLELAEESIEVAPEELEAAVVVEEKKTSTRRGRRK